MSLFKKPEPYFTAFSVLIAYGITTVFSIWGLDKGFLCALVIALAAYIIDCLKESYTARFDHDEPAGRTQCLLPIHHFHR